MNDINSYLLGEAKRLVADARGRYGRDWLTFDENVVSLVIEGMKLALNSESREAIEEEVSTLVADDKVSGRFKEARHRMARVFDEDPDFFEVYVANVAMLLHDGHGITEYEARNKAAKDVLGLIFWDRI